MVVRFKDGRQDSYPVWENVILVEAASEADAQSRAASLAREGEGDSGGTFRWEQRPAAWEFGGVRKLVKCDSDPDAPTDGTEVTYSEMVLETEEDLRSLLSGRPVRITGYD